MRKLKKILIPILLINFSLLGMRNNPTIINKTRFPYQISIVRINSSNNAYTHLFSTHIIQPGESYNLRYYNKSTRVISPEIDPDIEINPNEQSVTNIFESSNGITSFYPGE